MVVKRTLCEFSSVELTGFELNGDDMAKRFMEKFYGNSEACVRHLRD